MYVKESLVLRRPQRDILAAKGFRDAHDLPEQADTSALLHAADDIVRFVFEWGELLAIATLGAMSLAAEPCLERRIVLRGPLRQRNLGSGTIGVLALEEF